MMHLSKQSHIYKGVVSKVANFMKGMTRMTMTSTGRGHTEKITALLPLAFVGFLLLLQILRFYLFILFFSILLVHEGIIYLLAFEEYVRSLKSK
jgi:hypothetical protein